MLWTEKSKLSQSTPRGYDKLKVKERSTWKGLLTRPEPQAPPQETVCKELALKYFSLIFSSIEYLDCFVQNLVFLARNGGAWSPHSGDWGSLKASLCEWLEQSNCTMLHPTTTCRQSKRWQTHARIHTRRLKIRKSTCSMFEVLTSIPSTVKLFD